MTVDQRGFERSYPCDTVVVGLGTGPRDLFARMAAGIPGVRAVGGAAGRLERPPVPEAGVICPCSAVTVDDLRSVWDRGFRELELIKRATLAGTGVCQGAVCMPHVRSFVAAGGADLPPSFTARPPGARITIGEAAAGSYLPAHSRTALHGRHLEMAAVMERVGGWYRPWNYGDPQSEYRAARRSVAMCDVSTLGKILVSGPDAAEFLGRIYPVDIASVRPGRARYAFLLDERGYVFEDGMVCRDSETRFFLTFGAPGAARAEMWLRDWADAWRMDVRILDRTASSGAISLIGPESGALLALLGVAGPPPFMGHAPAEVAGVGCRVLRLGFAGDPSYELHHRAADSVRLWRSLVLAGRRFAMQPLGLEVLEELRLERGHILVGVDSLPDSTPGRLGRDRAVRMDKGDFVGRSALARTSRTDLDRLLVGLEMAGTAPPPGSILRRRDLYAGFVTSSAWSRSLEKVVMLGWLHPIAGRFPDRVEIGGRTARRVPLPFRVRGDGRA